MGKLSALFWNAIREAILEIVILLFSGSPVFWKNVFSCQVSIILEKVSHHFLSS